MVGAYQKYYEVIEMFKRVGMQTSVGLSVLVLLLYACSGQNVEAEAEVSDDVEGSVQEASAEDRPQVIIAHDGTIHEAAPLDIERNGSHVYISMTGQITDI